MMDSKKIRWGLSALLAGCLFASASALATEAGYTMGGATVDVTPPIGVPLAGYGGVDRRIVPWDIWGKYKYAHFLKPSVGVLDPIRAKAVVITLGKDRALFLSIDSIGIEGPFYNDVKSYAQSIGINHVIVAATHTHSGPGGLGRNGFYSILATDRFLPKVYKGFLKGVREAITQAAAIQEPVTLYRSDFTANEYFHHSRRHHPDMVDHAAHLLIGKNSRGEVVGGFVNYGVHPTVLGEDNLKFSADFAGGIERQLTARLGSKNTILFMNAPEGDISPSVNGYADIDPKGAEFAELAAQSLGHAVELPRMIRQRTAQFLMPKGRLRLANCVKKWPKILKNFAIGGSKWFPRNFELTQLELGDVLMATWPGEPTSELGMIVSKVAAGYGYANTWNLALANGYLGYFLTEHDFAEGDYEVCVSYHGEKAGTVLIDSHTELLRF